METAWLSLCQFFRIGENCKLPHKHILDLNMIDIRHWKAYHAYYGDDSPIGAYLYDAQEETFRQEDYGTRVNNELASELTKTVSKNFQF